MSADEDPKKAEPATPSGETANAEEETDSLMAFLGEDAAALAGGTDGIDLPIDLPPLDQLGGLNGLNQLVGDDLNETDPDMAQTKEEAERERMKLLVAHFDEQQMSRYAAFRRANIRRASVRRFASQLLNQPISNNVAVVLAGMSKVLIGDIIELARDLQEKQQEIDRKHGNAEERDPSAEPEPLLPAYIRKAWIIYKQETGTVPGPKTRPGSANRFF